MPSEIAAPTPTANATEAAFSSVNNGEGGFLPITGGDGSEDSESSEQNRRRGVVEGATSFAAGVGLMGLVGVAWVIRRRNEGFARQARAKTITHTDHQASK